MFKPSPAREKKFYGVALFFIVMGIGIFSVGLVQWIGVLVWQWMFGWPLVKVLSGLVIMALGYVILELELIRHKE